ncbi:MAG: hypothetical protein AAGM67_17225, partial [Bacteroidota bacterium]
MAVIGDRIGGSDLRGVVVCVRYPEDSLAVWNGSCQDETLNFQLRDSIRHELRLPSFVKMDYKPNEMSLHHQSDRWRK